MDNLQPIRMNMRVTKSPAFDQKSGRVRWQAVISTTDKDSAGERFDASLLDELVMNFNKTQEGEYPPVLKSLVDLGWDGVIVDPAHLSLFVPLTARSEVRVGLVEKVYRDGSHLKAQGFLDNSEQGRAVLNNMWYSGESLQTSIVAYVPNEAVDQTDDGVVYRGGSGRAFIDSIGITTVPINKATDFAVIVQSKAADLLEKDVIAVLGEDVGRKLLAKRQPMSNENDSGEAESVAAKSEVIGMNDFGDVVAALDAQASTPPAAAPVPAVAPASAAAPAPLFSDEEVSAIKALLASRSAAVEPVAPAAPVAAPAPAAAPASEPVDVAKIIAETQEATVKSLLQVLDRLNPVRRSYATPPIAPQADGKPKEASFEDVVALMDERKKMFGVGPGSL